MAARNATLPLALVDIVPASSPQRGRTVNGEALICQLVRLRTQLLGVLVCTVLASGAVAEPVEADPLRFNLDVILSDFAERTGTRFILDPRVRAKVTLIGTEIDALTAKDISRILVLYGFEAYTSDDIVYVLPNGLPDSIKGEFGPRWPQ